MKKIIFIMLFVMFFNSSQADFQISERDKNALENFKSKALEQYLKNPDKAYAVWANINKALDYYSHPLAIYALNYILDFTKSFINSYELYLLELDKEDKEDKDETHNQENNHYEDVSWEIIFSIDQEIINQYNNLDKLTNNKNLTHISSFDIEANIDHIILKNLYLKNTWTISNTSNLFWNIYLIKDDFIISKWYELNWFLNFDIKDYIIKRGDFVRFHVYADIKEPNNIDQTGELILDFSTPSNAIYWTSNGIKAISYSNWSDITSNVSISNPIKTLITKTSHFVGETNFKPSYSKAVEFNLNNRSRNRLDIKKFEFRVYWSFLNHIWDNTEFILKRAWTNQVFWTAKKSDINNWKLTINHSWNDYNFMSAGTTNTYELEIIHEWNPDWSREIRLQNIVIWDWFWWWIENLDDFVNTWLPWDYFNYRY